MVLTRPEERVQVDLDLRVWGMGADGRVFSQNARAHNISAGGALLCEIDRDLKIGDTIGIQRGERKARCKVVWAKNTRSIQKIQAGVQLLSKPDCPWIALLPKAEAEAEAPIAAPGRRRWERHKIAFLIVLHDERTPVPIRVTATDISGSGCYVETISPFPVGAGLGAELWMGEEKVTTRAWVRTSDPRVGMGLEFVGLKTEEQREFQNYLQAKYPFSCSIEHRNPGSSSRPI
jgi:hypothetical protein